MKEKKEGGSLRNRKKVKEQSGGEVKLEGTSEKRGNEREEKGIRQSSNTESIPENWRWLIVLIVLTVRISGALFSNLNDCDEVFNYYEPTHFLQHQFGLQTWEYSPVYAIRSWSYVLLHWVPLKGFGYLTGSKVAQFYLLRVLLATISGCLEISLYRKISTHLSPKLGLFTLIFLVGNSGMFHAAPAYLPSSFAMLTTMVFFMSAILPVGQVGRTGGALLSLAVGCLLGWPFSAAVGIPFALEEILGAGRQTKTTKSFIFYWFKNLWNLLLSSLKYFIYVSIPIVLIDYYFYKKITLVPFNIVLYNVLGASEDSGPNIFGTEPWFFYILNLFLNFNLGSILALISLPLLFLDRILFHQPYVFNEVSHLSLGFKLIPVYWWLLIYSTQPHKEERFMFVIYSLLAFNAAVSVYFLHSWMMKINDKLIQKDGKVKKNSYIIPNGLVLLCFISFLSLSSLRTYGQFQYYGAPMKLYRSLYQLNLPSPPPPHSPPESTTTTPSPQHRTLCLGDEWYRFPSHYFLPSPIRLSFIKAEFDGLLPKPFMISESGSIRESTATIPTTMNNENKEEFDRYIPPSQCDFMILNLPLPTTTLPGWQPVNCHPFLDPASLPTWRRAFYLPDTIIKLIRIPLVKPKYTSYCLLRTTEKDENLRG